MFLQFLMLFVKIVQGVIQIWNVSLEANLKRTHPNKWTMWPITKGNSIQIPITITKGGGIIPISHGVTIKMCKNHLPIFKIKRKSRPWKKHSPNSWQEPMLSSMIPKQISEIKVQAFAILSIKLGKFWNCWRKGLKEHSQVTRKGIQGSMLRP